MGGHVVRTLQRVLVVGLIFWHQTVEDGLHIDTHIGVAILVDAQSTTCVLREDVDDARLWQLGQLTQYLVCHKMKASRFGLQCYFYLLYHKLINGLSESFQQLDEHTPDVLNGG